MLHRMAVVALLYACAVGGEIQIALEAVMFFYSPVLKKREGIFLMCVYLHVTVVGYFTDD